MSGTLSTTTRSLDPLTDPRWTRLLELLGGDVFHAPAWLRVLARTYGFEPRALVQVDAEGEPLGGLVSCTVDDALGTREVSLPFSDYCDPLVADEDGWRALAEPWLATEATVRLRCLRAQAPLFDERLERAGGAFWHATDLDRDAEELWRSLHPTARRAIGKAERAGVMVEPARSLSDLRAFFELHLGVRKQKYRLLAQPYAFFEHLWEEFLEPGDGALLLARTGRHPIAGVLLLAWNDRLYYKLNASDPACLDLRPNDLLVWRAMQLGQERGAKLLDFGVSDTNQPGLVHYKRKFADREGSVTCLRRPGSSPDSAAELRSVLSDLTGLLTESAVPDDVTERAGARLYRFFA